MVAPNGNGRILDRSGVFSRWPRRTGRWWAIRERGWNMIRTTKDRMDLETLMLLAKEKANRESDGHLTVMFFTTNVKAMLGTPAEREDITKLSGHGSLKDALMELLLENPNDKFGMDS